LLSLVSLDPVGAEVLDYFGQWCAQKLGGPFEVFSALDDDESDSLTAQEFIEGLVSLGFFSCPSLPESVSSPELARRNLYPCLDQGGKGAISASELLFLEKDVEKRDRIQRELTRIRKYGKRNAADPLPKEASIIPSNRKGVLAGEWLPLARRAATRLQSAA